MQNNFSHTHKPYFLILFRVEMEKCVHRNFLVIGKMDALFLTVVEYYWKKTVLFQICIIEILT